MTGKDYSVDTRSFGWDWVLENILFSDIVCAIHAYTHLHKFGVWPEEHIPEGIQKVSEEMKRRGGSGDPCDSMMEVFFLRAYLWYVKKDILSEDPSISKKVMTWEELNECAVEGDIARCGAFVSSQFIKKKPCGGGYGFEWVPYCGSEFVCKWSTQNDWVIL